MRRGTPGFVGDRLREAREVRGLTAVALAEIAEVSPQAVSQYEMGRSSPSPEMLRTLAGAVNMPVHFFTKPMRDYERGTVFYRSMSSATKSARTRAERRFAWLRDIVRYLAEFVQLPQANFPNLNIPADPLLLSNEEIEAAAHEVRQFWGLRSGPIANMVLLMENHGAVLARDRLGAETLDGLSEFVGEERRPFVIIGTDKGTPVRWRFDAAHELGHIVLHAQVSRQRLLRSEHYKRIEDQAHRFAAAFLLPADEFGDDFFAANLDTLVALKPKWKVSVAMMITRAHRADFISDDAARRLWINYSRHGWKRNEPYDDSMAAEEPRLLRRSLELVLESGAQTADDVSSALALPLGDIESLCGVPAGFLNDYAPVALRTSAPQASSPRDSATNTPAQIISLRPRRREV